MNPEIDLEEERIMKMAGMKLVSMTLGMAVAAVSLAEQDLDARIARAKCFVAPISRPWPFSLPVAGSEPQIGPKRPQNRPPDKPGL